MANYITKIRTSEGDLPIDYKSLVNLPEWELIADITATGEIGNITASTFQDGTPLRLSKVLIEYNFKSSTSTYGSIITVQFKPYSSTNPSFGMGHMSAAENKGCAGVAMFEYLNPIGVTPVNIMSSYNEDSMIGALTYQNSYNNVKGGFILDDKGYIDYINIGGSGSVTATGGTCKIYGVRA